MLDAIPLPHHLRGFYGDARANSFFQQFFEPSKKKAQLANPHYYGAAEYLRC
jgi:hypothetical protein